MENSPAAGTTEGHSGDGELAHDEQVRAWMETFMAARREGTGRHRGPTDLQGWMGAFLDARSGGGTAGDATGEQSVVLPQQEKEQEREPEQQPGPPAPGSGTRRPA